MRQAVCVRQGHGQVHGRKSNGCRDVTLEPRPVVLRYPDQKGHVVRQVHHLGVLEAVPLGEGPRVGHGLGLHLAGQRLPPIALGDRGVGAQQRPGVRSLEAAAGRTGRSWRKGSVIAGPRMGSIVVEKGRGLGVGSPTRPGLGRRRGGIIISAVAASIEQGRGRRRVTLAQGTGRVWRVVSRLPRRGRGSGRHSADGEPLGREMRSMNARPLRRPRAE